MVLSNSEKDHNFVIPNGLVKRKVETLSYEAYTLRHVVTGSRRWEHLWERIWNVAGFMVHDETTSS